MEVTPVSFLKNLFGWGRARGDETAVAKEVEHKGFLIAAKPYLDSGQYQLAGTISRATGEGRQEHAFIRADRFASREAAAEAAIAKGRQLIDEQGGRLFG
jgi:hypothetical protein